MKRHGSYARYVLTIEQGLLAWQQTDIIRVRCFSCGTTHALLPADVIAYCPYSLQFLMFLYNLLLLEQKPVAEVAVQQQLSVWSVYLVLRRYERCRARIGLVLFELGCQPADHQQFTARECLEQIKAYGLSSFIHRYWQHNRRYLWQSRFHNRASPPVAMGWHENGRAVFT